MVKAGIDPEMMDTLIKEGVDDRSIKDYKTYNSDDFYKDLEDHLSREISDKFLLEIKAINEGGGKRKRRKSKRRKSKRKQSRKSRKKSKTRRRR